MAALKLFTTIMKITLLPSFFKAVALAALACGTLALTSISLSSCGGGGADTDDTLDAQFARAIIGHKLAFDGQPTLLTICPLNYTRGTGRCGGSVQWSNTYPNCVITLHNTSKQGGFWQGQLSLTIDSQSSLSSDTNFRAFYGIPTGIQDVVVRPMAFDITIPEDFRRNAQGTYKTHAAQYIYTQDDAAKSEDIAESQGTLTIDPGT